MDREEEEFDIDMEIIVALLSRPKAIYREKRTMIDCGHDLLVRASKHLYHTESAKVTELLFEHNETRFHDTEKPLMRTDTIEHEIPTSGRHVRISPHMVTPGRRKIVENEICKMEKEGMITKSSDPWCSPIVLVRKKDGTICFCVDYQKLNDVSPKDSYPLPRINNILDAL